MKHVLTRIIRLIEGAPITLPTFATAFLALIIFRLAIENALGLFREHEFSFYFFEFSHTFLFFLCSFLILLPLVRFAGSADFKKAANILLFGFLIILTPPIIDTIIFQGSGFWSFYEFDGIKGLAIRFFTLFGDTPNIGITWGVRIEVVLTSALLGAYAYAKSPRLPRAAAIALAAYSVLFILGTFPSWITIAMLAFQKGLFAVNANDIAGLFLSPERIYARELHDFRIVLNAKMSIIYGLLCILLSAWTLRKEFPAYFSALWKNARLPQLAWHGGLLFLGMATAAAFSGDGLPEGIFHIAGGLLIFAAVESAWLASVVVNDLYDTSIDAKTNPARPLIEETIPQGLYGSFGVLFFAASILFSAIISFSAALLLIAYQALAWIYSAPPLRLKRFPIIATAIAAAAGMLVFSTGFLMAAPEQNLGMVPPAILGFLFLAYTLVIPLKDFKDIEGDRADHVLTIPVILGARQAKLLLGSLIFLCYFASPFILHAPSISFSALAFGSLAFWAIQRGTADERSAFSFRRLPGIIIAITTVYGAIIAAMLFA